MVRNKICKMNKKCCDIYVQKMQNDGAAGMIFSDFLKNGWLFRKVMIKYKIRIEVSSTMQVMTVDRDVSNAIASVEMEGFIVTNDERDLIYKLVRKEITLKDALRQLDEKRD